MKSLSHVQLFATPWSAAYQAPSSLGFSRQEYWSGVPSLKNTLDLFIFVRNVSEKGNYYPDTMIYHKYIMVSGKEFEALLP